jgi:hypothetical protein
VQRPKLNSSISTILPLRYGINAINNAIEAIQVTMLSVLHGFPLALIEGCRDILSSWQSATIWCSDRSDLFWHPSRVKITSTLGFDSGSVAGDGSVAKIARSRAARWRYSSHQAKMSKDPVEPVGVQKLPMSSSSTALIKLRASYFSSALFRNRAQLSL